MSKPSAKKKKNEAAAADKKTKGEKPSASSEGKSKKGKSSSSLGASAFVSSVGLLCFLATNVSEFAHATNISSELYMCSFLWRLRCRIRIRRGKKLPAPKAIIGQMTMRRVMKKRKKKRKK